MNCKRCASGKLKEYNEELAIHFPGLEGLDEPIVWGVSELRMCLDCGFVEFEIPDAELEQLRTNDFPADSQAVRGC